MRAWLAFALVAALAGCRQPAGEPRSEIGAACSGDGACGSGRRYYCATDHPGGYCESACRSDADCAPGAVCVGGGLLSKGDCHRRCEASAPTACRAAEGYRCVAAGDDATHDYCDPPGRSEVARRIRGRAWRW